MRMKYETDIYNSNTTEKKDIIELYRANIMQDCILCSYIRNHIDMQNKLIYTTFDNVVFFYL